MKKRTTANVLPRRPIPSDHFALVKKISLFVRGLKTGPKSSTARYRLFKKLASIDLEQKSTQHLELFYESLKVRGTVSKPLK